MVALKEGEYSGRIIKSNYADGFHLNTIRYASGEEVSDRHYHENPHLCLLLSGADKEYCSGRTYERKSGDLFFYGAGEQHGTIARHSITKSFIVEMDQSAIKKYGLSETNIKATAQTLEAKFGLLRLLHALEYADNLTSLEIQSGMLALFSSADSASPVKAPKWLTLAEDYVQTHWNEAILLDALSAAVGVHPVTISRGFKRYKHCTLSNYIRLVRANKGLRLLTTSNHPLTEIAYQCGFADQSHFCRVFKQLTGFLPSALKNSRPC